jgi:hypothetical protein
MRSGKSVMSAESRPVQTSVQTRNEKGREAIRTPSR